MIINHNLKAMFAYRTNKQGHTFATKSLEKLSSGLRINRAADDAAGLAISEKMRAQIRGLEQSSRNIQDSISLVQTAEGGMQEIHSLLQRGRELSVQAANEVNTETDKKSIQDEINQIKEEIDRIANSTEFNTIKLLNNQSAQSLESLSSDEEKVMHTLLRSAFEQSEKMIEDYYGLTANNEDFQIKLEYDDVGGTLAFVTSSYYEGQGGPGFNISMTIDMHDFLPPTWPNGGGSFIYNDRIIAHEMVHAVMAATLNWGEESVGVPAIPKWFKEGTAEFMAGGDERLNTSLSNANIDGADIAALIEDGTGWYADGETDGDLISDHYSMGYAAVKYLHSEIKDAGGEGIKDVLDYLKADPNSRALDDALENIPNGSYTNGLADFASDFKSNGGAFIAGLNLTNEDVGAIGGFDADGGPVKTKASVVPDVDNLTDNPLKYFKEIWPEGINIQNIVGTSSNNAIHVQLGANQGQSMGINLPNVSSKALKIDGINVVDQPAKAISTFDKANETVSSERSKLGAFQNRLEHALSMNENYKENLVQSESRIRDVDMAKEMLEYTKQNILSQASQSMLAQANQNPQSVLQLLG